MVHEQAHDEGDRQAGRLQNQHPYFGGRPIRATLFEQPTDDENKTAHTIALMSHLAAMDASAPTIREAAFEAIKPIAERNQRNEAAAVWAWIKRHIRYTEDRKFAQHLAGVDAAETEVLIRPVDLLDMKRPAGDCDDFSMLAVAMCRALGIRADFRTVAADPSSADYTHVYAVAFTPEGELPLDASHGPAPGWETPAHGKRKTWRVEPMNNLGFIATDAAIPFWQQAAAQGINTASTILTTRLAVPPAGTYSGPGGIFNYGGQTGQYPTGTPTGIPAAPGFNMTWVLLAVAAAALLMLMKK